VYIAILEEQSIHCEPLGAITSPAMRLLRTGDSTSSDPVVTTALAGAVEGQQVSRLLRERVFDLSGLITFHAKKMWQSSGDVTKT